MENNSISEQYGETLARAAHGGNREARNTLYLRHRELISRRTIPAKRLARVLERHGASISAEDVEQECFLIFCRLVEEWEPGRVPFAAFLSNMIGRAAYGYVRNLHHLRSSRVRWARLSEESTEAGSLSVQRGNTADDAGAGEQSGAVAPDPAVSVLSDEAWRAFACSLRADRARMVRLRFWEDKSSMQIARIEGCSQRTVNRTLAAVLAHLRATTEEEWEAV